MINLHDIRYVRLGTRDLDRAIEFATKIVGLELVRREAKAAYFRSDRAPVRGDTRDHTLVYFQGDPHDQTAAFELRDPADFDAAATALERAGHRVRIGTKVEADERRVRQFMAFRDATGNRIEIVVRPYYSGVRYHPGRDAGVTGFRRIGMRTSDAARDEAFWTHLFNARVSDWIGEAPLLRIGTAHHSLALYPADRPGIQHVDHEVEDFDDIMRSWYFLRGEGVRIRFGPGRDPASQACFLYFEGPDKMLFKYSTGMQHIRPVDEAVHRPRQFPFTVRSFCMWGAVPDIVEFDRRAGDPDHRLSALGVR